MTRWNPAPGATDLRHAFIHARFMDDGEPPEPTPAAEPDQAPAGGAAGAPEAEPEPPGNPEAKRLSDEAARYRHRAKDAEAKVDDLTGQVRTLTLRLAFTTAAHAANLTDTDAAWKLAADDLRVLDVADDGTVDTDRLTQIVDHVTNRYPYLATTPAPAAADQFPPPRTPGDAGRRGKIGDLNVATLEAKFPALRRRG